MFWTVLRPTGGVFRWHLEADFEMVKVVQGLRANRPSSCEWTSSGKGCMWATGGKTQDGLQTAMPARLKEGQNTRQRTQGREARTEQSLVTGLLGTAIGDCGKEGCEAKLGLIQEK